MVRNIIFQQKEERDSLLLLPYIERIDVSLKTDYLSTNLIKLVTGPRRSGKSVLSLQLLKDENFAYLNFDDDLLLTHFEENEVVKTLNEVYPGHRFLFLDEIQNLPNWELWVNKLFRRGENLIVTGSNAKLLSHEMASTLTGRYIQIPVFPFSFKEVLFFRKETITKISELSPQHIGVILNHLNIYIIDGGFPESVLNPSIIKNYLSTLFDSVILKDIMQRFHVRNSQQLYDLSNYFLANFTNPFTFNQLKTVLKFNSTLTVQKFADYLSEPYLFQYLTRYSSKIKTQQKSPIKTYIIDNGFIKARSFQISPNYGKLLENIVFIELLRRNYKPELDIFYYKTRNDREIDFLCRKGHAMEQLIQVCYDITSPKTFKREIEALFEASSELSCNNLLIITWDKEEIINHRGININLVPAWKWLL